MTDKGSLDVAVRQLEQLIAKKYSDQPASPQLELSKDDVTIALARLQSWLASSITIETLPEVCTQLVALGAKFAPMRSEAELEKLSKELKPSAGDMGNTTVDILREDSLHFFLLDSLHLILANALLLREAGNHPHPHLASPSENVENPGNLSGLSTSVVTYCYQRLHHTFSPAVRHQASICLGLLSARFLKQMVTIFSEALISLKRHRRNFATYQRAVGLLRFSVDTPQQAQILLDYLSLLAKQMNGMDRGVLREAVCLSLREVLQRVVAPKHPTLFSQWTKFKTEQPTLYNSFMTTYDEIFNLVVGWSKKAKHWGFAMECAVILGSLPDDNSFHLRRINSNNNNSVTQLLLNAAKKDALQGKVTQLVTQMVDCASPTSLHLACHHQPALINKLLQELFFKHQKNVKLPFADAPVFINILKNFGIRDFGVIKKDVLEMIVQKSPASPLFKSIVFGALSQIAKTAPEALGQDAMALLNSTLYGYVVHRVDEEVPIVLAAAIGCYPSVPMGDQAKVQKVMSKIVELTFHPDPGVSNAAALASQEFLAADVKAHLMPTLFCFVRVMSELDVSNTPQLVKALASVTIILDSTLSLVRKGMTDGSDQIVHPSDWIALRQRLEAVCVIWLCHPEEWVRQEVEGVLCLFCSPEFRSLENVQSWDQGIPFLVDALLPHGRSSIAAQPESTRSSIARRVGGDNQPSIFSEALQRVLHEDFDLFSPPFQYAFTDTYRDLEELAAMTPEDLKSHVPSLSDAQGTDLLPRPASNGSDWFRAMVNKFYFLCVVIRPGAELMNTLDRVNTTLAITTLGSPKAKDHVTTKGLESVRRPYRVQDNDGWEFIALGRRERLDNYHMSRSSAAGFLKIVMGLLHNDKMQQGAPEAYKVLCDTLVDCLSHVHADSFDLVTHHLRGNFTAKKSGSAQNKAHKEFYFHEPTVELFARLFERIPIEDYLADVTPFTATMDEFFNIWVTDAPTNASLAEASLETRLWILQSVAKYVHLRGDPWLAETEHAQHPSREKLVARRMEILDFLKIMADDEMSIMSEVVQCFVATLMLGVIEHKQRFAYLEFLSWVVSTFPGLQPDVVHALEVFLHKNPEELSDFLAKGFSKEWLGDEPVLLAHGSRHTTHTTAKKSIIDAPRPSVRGGGATMYTVPVTLPKLHPLFQRAVLASWANDPDFWINGSQAVPVSRVIVLALIAQSSPEEDVRALGMALAENLNSLGERFDPGFKLVVSPQHFGLVYIETAALYSKSMANHHDNLTLLSPILEEAAKWVEVVGMHRREIILTVLAPWVGNVGVWMEDLAEEAKAFYGVMTAHFADPMSGKFRLKKDNIVVVTKTRTVNGDSSTSSSSSSTSTSTSTSTTSYLVSLADDNIPSLTGSGMPRWWVPARIVKPIELPTSSSNSHISSNVFPVSPSSSVAGTSGGGRIDQSNKQRTLTKQKLAKRISHTQNENTTNQSSSSPTSVSVSTSTSTTNILITNPVASPELEEQMDPTETKLRNVLDSLLTITAVSLDEKSTFAAAQLWCELIPTRHQEVLVPLVTRWMMAIYVKSADFMGNGSARDPKALKVITMALLFLARGPSGRTLVRHLLTQVRTYVAPTDPEAGGGGVGGGGREDLSPAEQAAWDLLLNIVYDGEARADVGGLRQPSIGPSTAIPTAATAIAIAPQSPNGAANKLGSNGNGNGSGSGEAVLFPEQRAMVPRLLHTTAIFKNGTADASALYGYIASLLEVDGRITTVEALIFALHPEDISARMRSVAPALTLATSRASSSQSNHPHSASLFTPHSGGNNNNNSGRSPLKSPLSGSLIATPSSSSSSAVAAAATGLNSGGKPGLGRQTGLSGRGGLTITPASPNAAAGSGPSSPAVPLSPQTAAASGGGGAGAGPPKLTRGKKWVSRHTSRYLAQRSRTNALRRDMRTNLRKDWAEEAISWLCASEDPRIVARSFDIFVLLQGPRITLGGERLCMCLVALQGTLRSHNIAKASTLLTLLTMSTAHPLRQKEWSAIVSTALSILRARDGAMYPIASTLLTHMLYQAWVDPEEDWSSPSWQSAFWAEPGPEISALEKSAPEKYDRDRERSVELDVLAEGLGSQCLAAQYKGAEPDAILLFTAIARLNESRLESSNIKISTIVSRGVILASIIIFANRATRLLAPRHDKLPTAEFLRVELQGVRTVEAVVELCMTLLRAAPASASTSTSTSPSTSTAASKALLQSVKGVAMGVRASAVGLARLLADVPEVQDDSGNEAVEDATTLHRCRRLLYRKLQLFVDYTHTSDAADLSLEQPLSGEGETSTAFITRAGQALMSPLSALLLLNHPDSNSNGGGPAISVNVSNFEFMLEFFTGAVSLGGVGGSGKSPERVVVMLVLLECFLAHCRDFGLTCPRHRAKALVERLFPLYFTRFEKFGKLVEGVCGQLSLLLSPQDRDNLNTTTIHPTTTTTTTSSTGPHSNPPLFNFFLSASTMRHAMNHTHQNHQNDPHSTSRPDSAHNNSTSNLLTSKESTNRESISHHHHQQQQQPFATAIAFMRTITTARYDRTDPYLNPRKREEGASSWNELTEPPSLKELEKSASAGNGDVNNGNGNGDRVVPPIPLAFAKPITLTSTSQNQGKLQPSQDLDAQVESSSAAAIAAAVASAVAGVKAVRRPVAQHSAADDGEPRVEIEGVDDFCPDPVYRNGNGNDRGGRLSIVVPHGGSSGSVDGGEGPFENSSMTAPRRYTRTRTLSFRMLPSTGLSPPLPNREPLSAGHLSTSLLVTSGLIPSLRQTQSLMSLAEPLKEEKEKELEEEMKKVLHRGAEDETTVKEEDSGGEEEPKDS